MSKSRVSTKKATTPEVGTPEVDTPEEEVAVRRMHESEGFGSYYTNDTQVQAGPWDITLIFGQFMNVDREKKEIHVQKVAEVRMSPQHARRVYEVLGEQLDGYENRFGKLPMPPGAISIK